jgi:peroxiredoxin
MGKKGILVALFVLSAWVFQSGLASATPLKAGEVLPEINLTTPTSSSQQAYLGLSEGDSFKVTDIKADLVIVEVFGVTCPHCNHAAPSVNKLYELIESNPDSKGKVKVIGIGVGNDSYEVAYFQKKHKVPFPLFDDEEYLVHEQIGEPGTPYFVCVKMNQDGSHDIIHAQAGDFESADKFLDMLLLKSGLK